MREVFALQLHFNSQNQNFFGLPNMHSFSENIFLLFSQFSYNVSTQKAARMDEWESVVKDLISSPCLWSQVYVTYLWELLCGHNIKDPVECCKFELSITYDTVVWS